MENKKGSNSVIINNKLYALYELKKIPNGDYTVFLQLINHFGNKEDREDLKLMAKVIEIIENKTIVNIGTGNFLNP